MAKAPVGAPGYRGGYEVVYRYVNDAFNILIALPLLIVSAPFFLAVALAILVGDGRPVFYQGVRLGRGKRLFTMYKFRTLVPDAEAVIGARVLGAEHRRVVTPVGYFLRGTRLDELPQLINILKRDMDVFGPRPQRPAVYEAICRHIKGYDRRFIVNPGLIGYPQLFLPHNAPKRIQSFVDNRFLWVKKRISWEVVMILYTIWAVFRKIALKALHGAGNLLQAAWKGRGAEKRELDRQRPRRAHVRILAAGGPGERVVGEGTLADINERAFLMITPVPLSPEAERYELTVSLPGSRGRTPTRRARCTGRLFVSRPAPEGGYASVVEYTPLTPFNFYLIHQYFLKGSMVG